MSVHTGESHKGSPCIHSFIATDYKSGLLIPGMNTNANKFLTDEHPLLKCIYSKLYSEAIIWIQLKIGLDIGTMHVCR